MLTWTELAAFGRTTKWLWGGLLAATVIASTLLTAARIASDVAETPELTRANTQRIEALERQDSLDAREMVTQHNLIALELKDLRRELADIKCWAKVAAGVPGNSLAGCALR